MEVDWVRWVEEEEERRLRIWTLTGPSSHRGMAGNCRGPAAAWTPGWAHCSETAPRPPAARKSASTQAFSIHASHCTSVRCMQPLTADSMYSGNTFASSLSKMANCIHHWCHYRPQRSWLQRHVGMVLRQYPDCQSSRKAGSEAIGDPRVCCFRDWEDRLTTCAGAGVGARASAVGCSSWGGTSAIERPMSSIPPAQPATRSSTRACGSAAPSQGTCTTISSCSLDNTLTGRFHVVISKPVAVAVSPAPSRGTCTTLSSYTLFRVVRGMLHMVVSNAS